MVDVSQVEPMKTRFDKQALRQQADRLCREHGAELVFLTIFGADLYGTAKPGGSDLDLRGVFLPTMESLVLGLELICPSAGIGLNLLPGN